MIDELVTILKDYAKTYLFGTIPENGYPSSYFTVWNINSPNTAKYNNSSTANIWEYLVTFYSTDPEAVNTVLEEAREDLEKAGWEVDGKGYDVRVDDVNYTGRAYNVFYYER